MVSFCGWFKSKRRGWREEKICCGVAQEEEKPEGERRNSAAAAAPEEEKPKGNDHDDEEEEEEEEEGDGQEKVEDAPPSAPQPPAEENPKGDNGKKAKKQGGKQEKKEGDGKKTAETLSPLSRKEDKPKGDGEKENRTEEPPSPPKDIELRVPMHCECCARKIRCILKRYEGVAEVATDWKTQKVVVKGKKAAANPLKVVEHLEREIDKKVHLLTPLPPPQPGKTKPKAKDQLKKKEEEEEGKKEEIVASFNLQMHCQACAQKITKKILKMKGVESAELDWKASKVTVRGVFTPEKLAGYVYKKTMKYAVVTRDQPAAPAREKKDDIVGGANLPEEEKEDAIDECKEEMMDKSSGESEEEEATLKQCCQAYGNDVRYPPNVCPLFGGGSSSVPAQEYPTVVYPHIFSDENPNACSLM